MLSDAQKDRVGIARKRALVGIERACARKVEIVLASIAKECVGRAARRVAPVADGAETRWAAQFAKAETPSGIAAARVGEDSSSAILRLDAKGKAAGEVAIGGGADFLLPATRKSVTGYFMFTSKKQAGTCAAKVNDAFVAIRDAVDKDGNALGFDPKRISRELLKEFTDWSKPYARMIARTGSIYAMNAGAQARYQDAGIERQEWWATEDDLTCPYCREQHEKTVAIGDPFASNDKPATRADGKPGTLSLPGASGAIEFPPLHPNCRCTIVPVIDEATLLEDEPEPEPEPIPAPLPPLSMGDLLASPEMEFEDVEEVLSPVPIATPPAPVAPPAPPPPPPPPPVPLAPVAAPLPAPAPLAPVAPIAPPPAIVPPPPPALSGAAAVDVAQLQTVRQLGGSTGARLMVDANGKQWVLKKGANIGHLREEYQTLRLYQAAGADVPDFALHGGDTLVTEYLAKGKELGKVMSAGGETAELAIANVRKHFVADAFFGNWDTVGMNFDNILISGKKSSAFRIDVGGSLRYRAQGAKKAGWGSSKYIDELATLRDPSKNAQTAKVFAGLSDDDILKQGKSLMARRKRILAAIDPSDYELKQIMQQRFAALKRSMTQVKSKIAKDKAINTVARTAKPNTVLSDLNQAEKIQATHPSHPPIPNLTVTTAEMGTPLQASEANAIATYTGSSYKEINRPLALGKEITTAKKTLTKRIDKGLEKLNFAPSGPGTGTETLYRKVTFDTDAEIDKFIQEHRQGEVIYRAYTSTTRDRHQFGNHYSSNYGARMIIEKSQSGRDVKALSKHPGEQETLFGRGTKFKIKRIEPDPEKKNAWFLFAEEI